MTLRITDTVEIGGTRFSAHSEPPLSPEQCLRVPDIRPPENSANGSGRGHAPRWRVFSGHPHPVPPTGLTLRMGRRRPHFADRIDDLALTLPPGERRRDPGHPYRRVSEAELEPGIRRRSVTEWRLIRDPRKRRAGFPRRAILTPLLDVNPLP